MSELVQRLLLTLAMSGMNEKEIYTLMREIDRLGPSAVFEMVVATRRHVKELPAAFFGSTRSAGFKSGEASVVDKVSRLLLEEANLSVVMATKHLKASLATGVPDTQKIPAFRSKEGFGAWVQILTRIFGASLILHHATRVRNLVTHARDNDWPLRDRSK